MIEIRAAGRADVPTLVALNVHVHDLHVAAAPGRYHPTDPIALAAWFGDQLLHAQVWLAIGDRPVGYLVTQVHDRPATAFGPAARLLIVDQIAVDAEVRGQGVGRRLMAHADALARAEGCARVELTVAAFNAGALAFYERLGFTPIQHRLGRVAVDGDCG